MVLGHMTWHLRGKKNLSCIYVNYICISGKNLIDFNILITILPAFSKPTQSYYELKLLHVIPKMDLSLVTINGASASAWVLARGANRSHLANSLSCDAAGAVICNGHSKFPLRRRYGFVMFCRFGGFRPLGVQTCGPAHFLKQPHLTAACVPHFEELPGADSTVYPQVHP